MYLHIVNNNSGVECNSSPQNSIHLTNHHIEGVVLLYGISYVFDPPKQFQHFSNPNTTERMMSIVLTDHTYHSL